VREHNFSLNGLIGFDLAGKTVGVIGTGKIGKIAAQIFRGFDMRALAYDPYPAADWAKERGVEYVDLETLLRQSDIAAAVECCDVASSAHADDRSSFERRTARRDEIRRDAD
jgi:lactate dehydrogenase-like 2-hydroxyacid dehydrogenase